MHRITVTLAGASYDIIIGEGLLERAGEMIPQPNGSQTALLVSDSNVFALFGERCVRSLQQRGWRTGISLIRPGERSKNLTTVRRIYSEAMNAGLDRHSPVIALGGGVVGDLAGFVAATYLRGVPLIQVPTTLLAQVDSSVGGKTAVNHPRGKNLIGAFHHPALVLSDLSTLEPLPLRQLRAGAAEVIKGAVIGDSALFRWLEENLHLLLKRKANIVAEAISRSLQLKAHIVRQDEREDGCRRLLNFGHTVGHALESATAYRYYIHGEAIAAGMSVASEVARLQGMLDGESAARIQVLLGCLSIKKPPADVTPEQLLERMRYDKKRRGDNVLFVLPTGIGSADYCTPADLPILKHTLIRLLSGEYPLGVS